MKFLTIRLEPAWENDLIVRHARFDLIACERSGEHCVLVAHLHLDLIINNAVVDFLHELHRQVTPVIDSPVIPQEVLHSMVGAGSEAVTTAQQQIILTGPLQDRNDTTPDLPHTLRNLQDWGVL